MSVLSTGQVAREIARQVGHPIDRDEVAYAVRKLHIQPVGRAGLVRLFAPDVVDAVQAFLTSKRRVSS